MLRFIRIFTLILLALTGIYLFFMQPQAEQGQQTEASIGGDFSLIDQNGKTVTDESLKGKRRLVYFGYTYCPDICPTALLAMSEAAQTMKGDAPALVFITVDPERDTVAHLKEYAENFPGVIALTGSAESVKQAARSYRVYYEKKTEGSEDGTYLVDHSGFIYLMDEEGKYLSHFPHDVKPQTLVETLRALDNHNH